MTKASDNVFPRLLISEGGSTTTPAAGNVTVYAKADGLLYSKDDAGAETALGGGSGDVATDAIWAAEGDIAYATGAGAATVLTAGDDDDVLTLASGVPTWAAPTGGYATFSGARVYHSTTQSVGAAVTALSMDSEDFDTGSYHDNSTNNSRLTVPATGYYLITGHVQFDNTGTNIIGIRIDGSTQVRGSAVSTASGQNKLQTVQVAYLTSGQYVELWAYQSGTANVGDTTYAENMNSFSIMRLA